MKIILLEKYNNLGNIGDYICVKSGYARNFLIPRKKAIAATKKNIEHFKLMQLEINKIQEKANNLAIEKISLIKKLHTITIVANAGYEGKLFGSISKRHIAKVIHDAGIIINKNDINLTEKIKYIGNYIVKISINDHETNLNVHIVSK